jgi:hypothetical protein
VNSAATGAAELFAGVGTGEEVAEGGGSVSAGAGVALLLAGAAGGDATSLVRGVAHAAKQPSRPTKIAP